MRPPQFDHSLNQGAMTRVDSIEVAYGECGRTEVAGDFR